MTPHRSEVESLRAENDRLRAKVAEMEEKATMKTEKVPMRWGLKTGNLGSDYDTFAAVFTVAMAAVAALYAAFCAVAFVGFAHLPMGSAIEQRGGIVFAILALAWSLAFVRRVPR